MFLPRTKGQGKLLKVFLLERDASSHAIDVMRTLANSQSPLNYSGILKRLKIARASLADNLTVLKKLSIIEMTKEVSARVPGGKKKYYDLTPRGILYYLEYLLQEEEEDITPVITKYRETFPVAFGHLEFFSQEGLEDQATFDTV